MGRPKGSKNKPKVTTGLPEFLNRTLEEAPQKIQKDGRFRVEEFNDEVSSILYRELRVPTFYIRDSIDGDAGRYIARVFDERFANLFVDFLNGRKRVPKRMREQIQEVLDG
jgi:hypothetical protein